MFIEEPRDVVVGCGVDQVAVFSCLFTGSVAQPYWTINATEYTSINMPRDHSYSENTLRVSNVKEKNGTQYHCFLLKIENGVACAYQSTIGQLILNCKGKLFINFTDMHSILALIYRFQHAKLSLLSL